ncbi:16125_t:CDS:2, partial [Funneliformis geosporum]
GFLCFTPPSSLHERVMTRKNAVKQKNSNPKFVPYVAPKNPKEAAISPPATSSSSTSTSVPSNLDIEIVKEVFGSPPTKEMESKLLDPDEHLDDDDMDEDLKDFTVVTKATPFAVANSIKFTPKEKNNSKIILAINNIFAQNDEFKGVSVRRVNLTRSVVVYFATSDAAAAALHVTIPELKIEKFFDYTQYKTDMQFNERTIHVTDIPLQMKPANIKQIAYPLDPLPLSINSSNVRHVKQSLNSIYKVL